MKIRGVRINNRRKAFEVRTSSRRMLLPFAKVAPKPTAADPAGQGPRTPNRSSSTTRIPIRLGTSATQFYRLLDQTNYRKSVDQLVSLLQILDCDVRLVVRPKTA